MDTRARLERTFFWIPRALALLFVLFMGASALDVFTEGASPGEVVVGFAVHLVPAAVVLAALVLAWGHEVPGGLAFIALGLLYVWLTRGSFDWTVKAVVAGPAILVGVLFLIHDAVAARTPGRQRSYDSR